MKIAYRDNTSPYATLMPTAAKPVGKDAPKKIVLVEDDPEIAEEIVTYLQKNGFVVKAVPDGATLRASCNLGEFDLMLMDLNPNSLAAAARRIQRYEPKTHQGNALEPFGLDAAQHLFLFSRADTRISNRCLRVSTVQPGSSLPVSPVMTQSYAGVSALVQPGGSMRDAEVISAVDAAGAAMMFTGIRHFRH